MKKQLALLLAAAALACGATEAVNFCDLPEKAKVSHMAINSKNRTNDDTVTVTAVPPALDKLPMVSIPRGEPGKPGAGYSFTIDKPATVYILVADTGAPAIPPEWVKLENTEVAWKVKNVTGKDFVYSRKFPAGKVEIPPHNGKGDKAYGLPNTALVKPVKS